MRARSILGAILVTATVLPAAASAAPKPKPHGFLVPDSFSLRATLPKSHGYSLALTSDGHRQITLFATREGVITAYSAKGRANRNRLDVDFGRFGRIDLRFHGRAVHPEEETLLECRGPAPVQQAGVMRGRIRFRGIGGLLQASASRVRATTTHEFQRFCTWGGSSRHGSSFGIQSVLPRPQSSEALTTLEVESNANGRSVFLGVLGFGKFGSIALGGARQRLGRVKISSLLIGVGKHRSLVLSKPGSDPETARLKLAKPFVGTGRYEEGRGEAPTWTGTLRVPIPGEGQVPLAGDGFRALLCRSDGPRHLKGCESGEGRAASTHLADLLDLAAQGSGSHSQAFWDAKSLGFAEFPYRSRP